jgi:hypothetical protein
MEVKMIRILLTLTFLMNLVSCSQQAGETSAKFKVSMGAIAGAPANFQGGLMLYGRSGDGNLAFGRVLSVDNIEEYVPNGVWHFYAVGWDGPNAMEGKVYCGHLANVNLDGNPVDLNLVASNANCNTPIFSANMNGSTEKTFPDIEIETCNKLSHVSSEADDCTYNPISGSPTRNKGYAVSYSVELKSFNKAGNNYTVLPTTLDSDRCAIVENGAIGGGLSSGALNFLNIPLGNARTPFYTVLKAYYGTDDCDTTTSDKGRKNIVLKSGLNGNDFHYKAYSYDSGGPNYKVKIFARVDDVDVCQRNRLGINNTPHPFAAGAGTQFHPYVICNAKQLNSIANGFSGESFKLLRNIDLNSERKALNAGTNALCAQGGENFTPIGGYTNTEAAGFGPCGSYLGSAYTGTAGSIAFTGRFDGNDKIIKNLELNKNGTNDIGFVRKLNGGAIFNLTFEKADVEGKNRTGIVVGSVLDTGTASKLLNIEIKASKVESANGNNDLGALVGRATKNSNDIDIKNIFVKDVDVITYGSGAGGIVGYGGGIQLRQAFFDGHIVGSQPSSGDIGGIVGYLFNGTVEKVAFSGVAESQGPRLGGIVGKAAASNVIKHVASRGLVYSKMNTPGGTSDVVYVGGIVGDMVGAATTFKYGYFNGKVMHTCNNITAANCLVGSITGNNDISDSEIYVNTDLGDVVTSSLGGRNGPNRYSYDDLLSSSTFGSIANAYTSGEDFNYVDGAVSSGVWRTMIDGYHAKMSFEDVHPCEEATNIASITTQDDTRGLTASNPIRICTRAQMKTIPTSTTLYYKLMDNIFLGNFASDTEMAVAFNGDFNGNYKKLLAPDYGSSTTYPSGIFSSVSSSGNIYNLGVYGVDITGTVSFQSRGGIAGTNAGVIEDVQVDILSAAYYKTGGIVGMNSGTIKNAKVTGHMKGKSALGGVVSVNASGGLIEKVISYVNMGEMQSTFDNIGGVAGSNNGQISKVSYQGRIDTGGNGGHTTNPFVGGITGHNETSGTISNSAVSYHTMIETKSDEGVGGLVGNNEGTITNSFSYATVLTTAAAVTTDVGGAIGKNSGTVNSVYYNMPGMKYYQNQLSRFSSVSCAGSTITLDLSGGFVVGKDPDSYVIKFIGDNNKEIFVVPDGSNAALSAAGGQTIVGNEDCSTDIDYSVTSEIAYYTASANAIGNYVDYNEIGDFGTYCTDSLGGLTQSEIDNFTCSSGWDIIDDTYGVQRMLNYYTAIFQGNPPPASTPIWEMSQDFPGEPKVFELDKY